ncbi:sensor histidine kinase [Actinoalloteichus spitiensis]|uniref:sensor histidine kinase n=1 Tax=Actinoalloteichus spitiensis TaxID=252394 RepID=UPI0012F6CFBD|nr:histidine kinase [Actinoalloteichus spitiensis]
MPAPPAPDRQPPRLRFPVHRNSPVALLHGWRLGAVGLALLALLLITLPSGAIQLAENYALGGGLAVALQALQTLPLALSLVQPVAAWASSLAAGTAIALVSTPDGEPWPWPAAGLIAHLGVLLVLVGCCRWWTLLLAALAEPIAVAAVWRLVPEERRPEEIVPLVVIFMLLLVVGLVWSVRRDIRRRLREHERLTEEERARRMVLEDRARVAREMHDVVAHHMSVVTVQAETAPYRLADLPDAVTEEFAAIATSARRSLAEMRQLLGVLRSEPGLSARAPQPALDSLPELADLTRGSGVPVTLRSLPHEVARALPGTVQLACYRIVQEALSNVVRHAPGAATTVELAYASGRVAVDVTNEAPRTTGSPPLERVGTGHGVAGMRHRVDSLGGDLEAGPLPGGGFRVVACLPVGGGTVPVGGGERG